jgi:gliding motility-associated-like protein
MKRLSNSLIVLFVIAAAALLLPSRAKVSANATPASAKAARISAQDSAVAAMLISPKNGKTTDDPHQLFAWQAQTPARRGKITYQLKVAEIWGQQSAEAAAQLNMPHLLKEDLERTTYEVSASDAPFIEGKKYAWQVTVFVDQTLWKQSEVRSFIFRQQQQPANNIARIGFPPPTVQCNGCANGMFESGNLNTEPGWTGFTGSNSANTGLTMTASGFVPGRHTIMTCPGVDPVLSGRGINLPTTREGGYSVRLGNNNTNAEAEELRYSFVVSSAKPTFTFSYALVLEDPNHNPAEQPFFRYTVYVGSTQITQVTRVADLTNPFFRVAGNSNIVYRPWDCDTIDLSAFVGQQATILFTTADCSLGGHFGYAYLDAFCEEFLTAAFTLSETACANAPILADGTASVNETSHFWSIEESDQWWGRNPTTEVSEWFIGQEAGPKDLRAFYQSKGKQFKGGTYYRIKLAVRTNCIAWKETVKLLYIKPTPAVDAGPDRSICCTTSQPVQIGTPAIAGYTYSWTSSPAGFTSNQAQPSVKPTCDTTYTLTVTGPNGCPATDTVNVLVSGTFKVSISPKEGADVCDQSVTLTAIVEKESCSGGNCATTGRDYAAYTKIQWSTGETTPEITVKAYDTQSYSVTVSNACYTKTAQITVPKIWGFNGAGAQLIYPNAFTPNGDGLNDVFTIYEYGLGANQGPAYNALEWRLSIFNRWGGLIYQKEAKATNSSGFKNGEISWDGRPSGSNTIVQIDAYVWKLEIKNCSYKTSWVQVGLGSVSVIK